MIIRPLHHRDGTSGDPLRLPGTTVTTLVVRHLLCAVTMMTTEREVHRPRRLCLGLTTVLVTIHLMMVHLAILLVVTRHCRRRRPPVILMIVMTGDFHLQVIGMRLIRQVRPLRDLEVP
jgi:hypothetical protein